MSNLALINELIGLPPNASEHGYQIDHIIEFAHWFMAALFVGWTAFFIYVLVRFRRSRHPVADHEGVKSAISTHLEFAVVLVEAVMLIGFAIPLWAKRVNSFPSDKDAIIVHAVGQQFNWTFHLPGPDGIFGKRSVDLTSASNQLGLDSSDPAAKDDLVTTGTLHVPKDRPVIIELSSKDVIHNFALPSMRIAQDATPGQLVPMWFKPIKTGEFEIVCGQLCGLGHYSMKGQLVVDEPAAFQDWLKEQASLNAPATAPAPAERPPGEPPAGPTPGTIPPPGAPKTANPSGAPDGKPGEPPQAPSPSPSAPEHH
jgi:cytochrome c oxidase subunit 2